jgi:hypothetical protein
MVEIDIMDNYHTHIFNNRLPARFKVGGLTTLSPKRARVKTFAYVLH